VGPGLTGTQVGDPPAGVGRPPTLQDRPMTQSKRRAKAGLDRLPGRGARVVAWIEGPPGRPPRALPAEVRHLVDGTGRVGLRIHTGSEHVDLGDVAHSATPRAGCWGRPDSGYRPDSCENIRRPRPNSRVINRHPEPVPVGLLRTANKAQPAGPDTVVRGLRSVARYLLRRERARSKAATGGSQRGAAPALM
jgi:hypothetical protein